MRTASVSIGVVDYEQSYYRSSSMWLRHAAADAAAFHRYASTGWSAPYGDHTLLQDARATLADMERTFSRLASGPRLDLLLVYLSGHGEVDKAGNGWFCLCDARQGETSLGTGALDSLLGRVNADRVILLVDCCHAEALVSGMPFFSKLDGNSTRVFVASARASQRAWEDESLRRSLFSDVLLRALSTASSIADSRGQVDLDAKLVPYLREQVPLNAAALKRGIEQTPVSGGRAVSTTMLPIVTGQSLGRELSVGETVRRRARQLIVAVAFAAIAAVCLIDALAYHLAVSGSGIILERPGLRWTYGLMPFHLGRSVETDTALDDLDPLRDDFFRSLADGGIYGLAGHLDDSGLRPSHAAIRGVLRETRHTSHAALATGEFIALEPDFVPAPVEEAAFLSELTGQPTADVGKQLYPLPDSRMLACEANPRLHYDFEILLAPSRTFEQDAAWMALTAPDDPSGRAAAVAMLTQLAAYRASSVEREMELSTEIDIFESAVWSLRSRSIDQKAFGQAAAQALAPLLQGWCLGHARLALATLSEPGRRGELEQAMLGDAMPLLDDLPFGRRTARQVLAYRSLALLAKRGLLDRHVISVLEERVAARFFDLCDDSSITVLIRSAAEAQPLSEGLVKGLRSLITTAGSADDPGAACAFSVLAANGMFLPTDARAEILAWAAQNADELRTVSSFHDGIGFLPAIGDHDERYRDILVARLSPMSRFPPEASSYRGAPIISPRDEGALLGLGRIAQITDLPDDVLERLANAAIGRTDIESREVILSGLAASWYRDIGSSDLADAFVRRFEAARMDSARRMLESEIAAVRLRNSSGVDRKATIAALLSIWREAVEPEIRVAIARSISWSVLGVRPLQRSVSAAAPEDFFLARTDE